MGTAITDYAGLQERKRLLLEELNNTQQNIAKVAGVEGSFDIHHPERSPGWPVYRHQEFPKMLYHPFKLNPQIETKRAGTQRRNEANPNLAPLELPASEALTITVRNKDEEQAAVAEGFAKAPPFLQPDPKKENSDPLADSVGIQAKPDVELILKLNLMSKEELRAHTANTQMPEDATKAQLIAAIVAKGDM